MDESRKPGNFSPAESPWQNGEDAGENLGATGVFGTAPGSNSDRGPGPAASGSLESAPAVAVSGIREGLQEPIVHKIVLGGGSASAPIDLLERLRAASAPSPPSAPGQSGEGFTQLLRGWSGGASLASPAKLPGDPNEKSDLPAPPVPLPLDGTGGFTAVLQGFAGSVTNFGEQAISPADTPVAASLYASEQATPGTFTQLLNVLTPEATKLRTGNASASTPEKDRLSPAVGGEKSFSQPVLTYGDRAPKSDDFSRSPSAGRESSFGSSQLPGGITDWSPAPPPSSGTGVVTQLLRKLEAPAKGPELPVVSPSAPNKPEPPGAQGSSFSQIYDLLDAPAAQPVPASLSGGAPIDQPRFAPVEPILAAELSPVTQIYEASRLREMLRSRAAAPTPSSNPAGPSQSAAPPGPLPSPAPNLHWQLPVTPNPLHGQPMPQYSPPAPMPQAPALAAPPVMGRMQQFLPLLLVVIIFLLVLILVTLVFLLKH